MNILKSQTLHWRLSQGAWLLCICSVQIHAAFAMKWPASKTPAQMPKSRQKHVSNLLVFLAGPIKLWWVWVSVFLYAKPICRRLNHWLGAQITWQLRFTGQALRWNKPSEQRYTVTRQHWPGRRKNEENPSGIQERKWNSNPCSW